MDNLVDAKLAQIQTGLTNFIERNDRRYKENDQRSQEAAARLMQLEQAFVSRNPGSPMGIGCEKSLGAQVVDSEGLAAFRKGAKSSGQIEAGSLFQKAVNIISGPWTVGPDYRPTIAAPAQPRLPLRALLPTFVTTSNLCEYPRETARSGSPDYQYPEATDKVQGDFTFALIQCPISTIAFWIACSKQVVDDSPALAAYVNGRLLYLMNAKVEAELLFGSGASGHISGLCTQATPASGAPSDFLTSTAAAISQLAAAGFQADFLVANPQDWWTARQLKAVGSGVYLIGDPMAATTPQVWGLAVSLSLSMPAGKFLIGVTNECAIADRQQATIEISRSHASFFTQNLIALLCEERLALLTYRPEAFVFGQVTTSGS
jgi:HK97 family phage major capsid protein